MVSWVKAFVLGFVVACVLLGWMARTHHVIRTSEGLKLVSRTVPDFENIFVDITGWGALDYAYGRNREVLKALGRGHLDRAREAAEAKGKELEKEIKQGLDDARKELDRVLSPSSPAAP